MKKLFESTSINGMVLSNRFVRSATWEGMATKEGAVTAKLIDTMTQLAKGGIGLIISSHSYVLTEGQASPKQLGIYKDELIPGLREMTQAVHQQGGKIIMQLTHAGNNTSEKFTGQPPLVVSDFEGLANSPRKELSIQHISKIVDAFSNAARRAQTAGFDGVQIHSAHGYLLSQFLSPIYNKRKDEYGGSITSRAKIHLEIYEAIRKATGKDFPILIKMNCSDFVEDGLSIEEAIQVGKLLENTGFDAIELSGGLPKSRKLSPTRPAINTVEKEAYFKEEAVAFKKEINIPLMLVGGVRSFEVAKQLVEDNTADYISMSRPLIREPELINRWKSGNHQKAECISDNLCFRTGLLGEGLYCLTKRREQKKI